MGHVPMQVIKDVLPLVKNGGPTMIKNVVKNLMKKVTMNDGTAIAGHVVLITGGSNGVGRLMAEECARRGAKAVIIWGFTQHRIDDTVARLQQMRCTAKGYQVDVSNREAVKAAAKQVLDEFGQVDILVHSAGVVSGAPLLELSDEAIDRTLGINLNGLFYVTREFLPGMVARDHGHIITLSSAAGTIGPALMTDYAASKWGARGFMESLRNELAKNKSAVKTLTVCPYYISTGMFDGVKTRIPLLLPILKPQEVSDKIIACIESGQQEVFMPPLVKYTSLMRVLPTHWFDAMANFLGINNGMNEFTGRK